MSSSSVRVDIPIRAAGGTPNLLLFSKAFSSARINGSVRSNYRHFGILGAMCPDSGITKAYTPKNGGAYALTRPSLRVPSDGPPINSCPTSQRPAYRCAQKVKNH